jgi:nucleoside-diphosphate-sugar epimerase
MLLVTGITGHSGRYFMQELIKNKYEDTIRCVVRNSSDTSLLDSSGLKIEKVVGDIRDEEFLNRCMKDVETVVHIVNIRHTLHIIKAAINNKVPRAICIHTTGIFSKFKAASGEYKVIENKLQEMIDGAEIKITILRPTMIYGDICDHNMSRFIKMVDMLRLFPVINHGKCLIQPVNARDLGKAYYSVLMMPSEKVKTSYNLSGEKPIKMLDAFKLISNNLGKKTTFISFPLGLGVLLARCLKVVTLGKVDYVEKVQRMGEDRCFSYEAAERDFGYSPKSFETGIAKEVKEYLSR